MFRKRAKSSEAPPQCLSLDDNDYPKHLWSFVFTGRPFRKRGPAGYQLAHLGRCLCGQNRRAFLSAISIVNFRSSRGTGGTVDGK